MTKQPATDSSANTAKTRPSQPRHHQRHKNAGEGPTKKELYAKLGSVAGSDVRWFRKRLSKAKSSNALAQINKDIEKSIASLVKRKAALPHITYPEQLPVSHRKDDIKEAIANNQVVIVAGETGSGKTTQLPKICLELGRGITGRIGHTQPRRLAARTVAERIASELGQDIGESVGYAIRFDDQVSDTTAVKLMTDGILLAEMQRDRYLNAYDTIIIDEAHERSLNIDFLLGYLKQLLPKRPDLKVIITSATIDPERFAEHFADKDGTPAPIIEVSGRTYPVEVRYRPLVAENGEKLKDIDPIDGLIAALKELMNEGDGDILCFFSGEADIREAREAIEGQKWKGVEVTPLYGRLSNQEQHRVFTPHSGRRIVLSTNIAETSLTVPGIHYVVDTGTARISRYSNRTKVQRLPIEEISQASANQRSGRCGRVADGIAIRLYSEENFLSRPEFTDPEILRTNLASVILQMASLRLGDIEDFPFIQKPDTRAIRDGVLLLHELGALDNETLADGTPKLTETGRTIARIPVDPRMARMLVEGERLGVLGAIYVVVAALTIQDVRERPLEHQAHADQLHARFKDTTSDFLSYIKLWDYLKTQRNELSGNAFKKLVQREYLHYMRIREWWDLVRQLKNIGDQLGWTDPKDNVTEPDADAMHQALLSGLLSQIGLRDGNSKEFIGARNTHFMIFPGSSLAKKPPQFVMAAELVETSRLWARDVAAIDPRWVERLAGDLLRHQYSEPHWSTKRVGAMVYQRSTLLGVPVVADRVVPFHKVDPIAAREMFIRHALIEGEWTTHHKFYKLNQQKLAEASEVEAKARRRDLLVDEETLFNFYDSKLPNNITTGNNFDRWWNRTKQKHPHLLDFDPDKLLSDEAGQVTEEQFPDTWKKGSVELELTYRFEPGTADDGVTVNVPIPLLAGLDTDGFEWLVPGVRLELVTELIRTLPKALRRTVVPAPNYAERVLPLLDPSEGPLLHQIADNLRKIGGKGINAEDFNEAELPDHLRVRFAAIDKRGNVVDADRDLEKLKHRRAGQIKSSVSKVSRAVEHETAKEWTPDTLGEIKDKVVTKVDGQSITTYPALVATKDGVAVKAMPTKAEADASMMQATLTLLMREITVNTQKMLNGLPIKQRVGVENYPHGGSQGLVDDARVAAIRDLMIEHGGPTRSPEGFQKLVSTIRPLVPGRVRQTVVALAPGLVSYVDIRNELKDWDGPAIDDMKRQLDFLLPKHAVSIHGSARLKHLPRYIQAMKIRLEDMGREPAKDEQRQMTVNNLERQLRDKINSLPNKRANARAVKDIQWLIQELRVSLFAQRLGTAQSVSERKISKAISALKA